MTFKNAFLKNIALSIKYFENLTNKLNSQNTLRVDEGVKDELTNLFEDLAPIDNADETKTYLNSLKWALKNKNINNVALTGPYGSGKSSIIKTFEKNHPEYNFLNISLATFKDAEPLKKERQSIDGLTSQDQAGELKNTINKDEDHRLIELSILQQMFYRETEERIPNSRFKRITAISKQKLKRLMLVFGFWFWGIVLLVHSNWFPVFTWWPKFYQNFNDYIIAVASAFTIPGFVNLLRLLIKRMDKISFSKLNLKSGEIEFNPKSETSILNKHLDEILYFFQVTPYNVVVIEDLDRFNDPEIFTKLRELNYLLNYSLQVNKRIVFLYAVKDDMFKDESRTKFFDFIIPVIPVINSNNSFEKLSLKLNQLGSATEFDRDFVSDITLYIDDMRALKNIFNEYIIYRSLLTHIGFKHNKLLAIIIYKNIHPSDFSRLHHNDGLLFGIFETKPEIVSYLTKDNERKIQLLKKRIDTLADNHVHNKRELRSIYLATLIGQVPHFSGFNINGSFVSFKDAHEDNNFELLTKSTNITYMNMNSYNRQYENIHSGISFVALEKSVDADRKYIERLQEITDVSAEGKSALDIQISKLRKAIADVKFMSLKELFEFDVNISQLLSAETQQDKLLLYLVREGWIDETYSSLTSYFYEGSISLKDMNFVMSVKNRESLAYDYQLEKVEGVVGKLRLEDFKRSPIFNQVLIDHLLDKHDEFADQLRLVIEQISKLNEAAYEFLLSYVLNGRNVRRFIKLLCDLWQSIWTDLEANPRLKLSDKTLLAALLIKYANIKSLTTITNLKKFVNFVEKQPDFLTWFEKPDFPAVENFISTTKSTFERLHYDEKSNELFDFVYSRQLFAINQHMIVEIFRLKGLNEEIPLLASQSYTQILGSGLTELINAVNKNISEYVVNVLLTNPSNKFESETTLIKLINNEKLKDHIDEILDQQIAVIHDITEINSEVWFKVFQHNRVSPTWHNVITYFAKIEDLDDVLIAFVQITPNSEELSKSAFNVDKEFEDDLYQKFAKKFLKSSISDKSFIEIIQKSPYYYPDPVAFSLHELSEKKIDAMIEYRKVVLNEQTYVFISEHFDNLRIKLIEKQSNEFFNERQKYELDNEDYLTLLKSNVLTLDQKEKLVAELNSATIDSVNGLASFLSKFLSEREFKSLTFQSLRSIILKSDFQNENVKLFYWHLPQFNNDQITDLLNGLGEPYIKLTEQGKHPSLPPTDINILLGKSLKAKNYIYNSKVEGSKLRFYNK